MSGRAGWKRLRSPREARVAGARGRLPPWSKPGTRADEVWSWASLRSSRGHCGRLGGNLIFCDCPTRNQDLEGSPNIFSWLVLLLVPLFAPYAYARWSPLRATMILLFGGSLFLPCRIQFLLPVLPDLDKEVLPALCALVACLVMRRGALRGRAFHGPEILAAGAALAVFGTILMNQDTIVHGPTVLPAQTWYDGLVDSLQVFVTWFPPFYLGRSLVRSSEDLRSLLRFVVVAALVYSVFILVELRMSPQFHYWVYGFHQSDFIQTIRYGGYRPKVFMRHGLNLALFMSIAVCVATALWRARAHLRPFWTPGRAAIVLLVVLLLCKSTGAYFYVAILLPVIALTSTNLQRGLAVAAVALILGYPLLRWANLVPADAIVEWMRTSVNEERAASLWFRFFTEQEVLNNASERLLFGWGGYGRPFNFDPETGQMTSVLDGFWVILLSSRGLIGWLCIFGMMVWPVLAAARALPRIARRSDRILVCALGLVTCLYVSDWIPNSGVSADLTFMCGALAGVVPGILSRQRRSMASPAPKRVVGAPLRSRHHPQLPAQTLR